MTPDLGYYYLNEDQKKMDSTLDNCHDNHSLDSDINIPLH
jgi:hypothetical protein